MRFSQASLLVSLFAGALAAPATNGLCDFSVNNNPNKCAAPQSPVARKRSPSLEERATCNCCLPAATTTSTLLKTVIFNYKTTITQDLYTATYTVVPQSTETDTILQNIVVSTHTYNHVVGTTPISTETDYATQTPIVTAALDPSTVTTTVTSTVPGPASAFTLIGTPAPLNKRALVTNTACGCSNPACATLVTHLTTSTTTTTLTTLISKQIKATTTVTVTAPSTSVFTTLVKTATTITEFVDAKTTVAGAPATTVITSQGPASTLYTTPPPFVVTSTVTTAAPASTTFTYSFVTEYGTNVVANDYFPYGYDMSASGEGQARNDCAQNCLNDGTNCVDWFVMYQGNLPGDNNDYKWYCGMWGTRNGYTVSGPQTDTYSGFSSLQVYSHIN